MDRLILGFAFLLTFVEIILIVWTLYEVYGDVSRTRRKK